MFVVVVVLFLGGGMCGLMCVRVSCLFKKCGLLFVVAVCLLIAYCLLLVV